MATKEFINCNQGQSSNHGMAECFDCPKGTSSIAGGRCMSCPMNTYKNVSGGVCKPCPEGFVSSYIYILYNENIYEVYFHHNIFNLFL